MSEKRHRPYLDPYLNAVRRHGARFESLLWASPQTQALRFEAIARLCDLNGMNALDVGCGRADLLEWLLARNIRPAHYLGLEAVPELAEAARKKRLPDCQIIQADFVCEPHRLLAGADVVLFCGSLNTLSVDDFYRTLRVAFEAATCALVFNFLCSPRLASADWLTWHRVEDVEHFLGTVGGTVRKLDGYYEGDCTIIAERAAD